MAYKSWPTIIRHWKRSRAWHSYPMVYTPNQTQWFPSNRKKRSSKHRLKQASIRSSPVPGPSVVSSESNIPRPDSLRREDRWSSDGRVQSTKRKDTAEGSQQGSFAKKSRSATSPRKRKCKTTKKTPLPDSCSANGKREHWLKEEGVESGSQCYLIIEDSESAYGILGSDINELTTKYMVMDILQRGGYGHVRAGVRIEDNLPVAIKYIPHEKVSYIKVELDGVVSRIPLEVYLLYKVGAGPASAGSTVTPVLLDWYDLEFEIALVLERPAPCMDLADYVFFKNPTGLDEKETKIIFRQLVDAAIEMESRGVFHRDIKPDNVLIETGNNVVKARFIDFGCGRICNPDQVFHEPQGTPQYASPEWFRNRPYKAGSTTVWQLGLVLYTMLFNKRPFITEQTIGSKRSVPVPYTVSLACKNLLKGCLQKHPTKRLSLKNIRAHIWLNSEYTPRHQLHQ